MSCRIFVAALCCCVAFAGANDANRLTYLDDPDPFYPTRDFPKLITPQWIGEPGVDAAIILSIDDMRDPAKYEEYLRPIIDALKRHYGKASMSIMACSVSPDDPQLQTWLAEGLSIETHTVAHPCPLLGQGQIDKAKDTFQSCIDLMSAIPGNTPVAFRMPCCDSINSLSPRFFHEIFNNVDADSTRLTIDSSVFNITTANDPELPREWVLREDGTERFRAYLPFKSFMTTIEDYPYPYIIGEGIWEFPCAVPSDWEAQNINKPYSPVSVADMKIALDVAVKKKGVYTLVFHPHGWIQNDQVVELIEHAVATHGNRIRFLSFRDAYQRLSENVLDVKQLPGSLRPRNARLVDLNNDEYLDVVYDSYPIVTSHYPSDINGDGVDELIPVYSEAGAASLPEVCKLWNVDEVRWETIDCPHWDLPARQVITKPDGISAFMNNGVRFGVDAAARPFVASPTYKNGRTFVAGVWEPTPRLFRGIPKEMLKLSSQNVDVGLRILDIDGDSKPEMLISNPTNSTVFVRSGARGRWKRASFGFPSGVYLVDDVGRDAGLRFVDIDGDFDRDIIFSNEEEYGVYLFESMKRGWSTIVLSEKREGAEPTIAIPPIAIDGQNNGAWFKNRTLWVANEHTDTKPDLVERRTFNDLLARVELGPKSPEAGLASISVRPGLKVKLVAAEPLIDDPVAIAFGPDGKLWVVEMRDYPLGMDGKGKPGSRVKFLEDVDGDGVYDKSTLFLDKLAFATGILPWRDGVLVTAAPLVFFARDKNGDGKADEQQTLFEGFGQGNQQHRVNGLRWGQDNWVHAANGDSGGAIKNAKSGEVTEISGRDFRFKPDQVTLDPQSGNSQFGIANDDWGSWFGCANWLPVWHYALDDVYLRRNPHFAPGNPREYVVEQAEVFPTSRTLARFNDFEHVNRTTSTCGIEIYRDTLLGKEFYGNAFVCEPVHNVVLRTVLEQSGPTFSGHRAPGEEQSDFLTSHDNWFRPVMARTGPDGALYVVDMYRLVIEHPEYISKETQATLDLRAGSGMGRIYRVSPVHGHRRAVPTLATMNINELVAQFESPNGTLRDLAHQLVIERADAVAVAPLRALATGSGLPKTRVRALSALDGLAALNAADLVAALGDSDAGVRRHALRLAEPRMNEWGELGPAVAALALASDTDPMVHMQLINTLGSWRDPRAATLLGEFIARDVSDQYFGMALLSSINADNLPSLIAPILAWASNPDAAQESRSQAISAGVGIAVAASSADTLQAMATQIAATETGDTTAAQYLWLAEFLDGLAKHGSSLGALGTGASADTARNKIGSLMASARTIALDESAAEEARAGAVKLMGHDPAQRDADIAALGRLIDSKNPAPVVSAALDTLLETGDDAVPGVLLAKWPAMPPESHEQIVEALLTRDPWLDALLGALEQGTPAIREIGATHRQRMLNHKREDVRQRAEKLLASVVNADRQAVIEQFKAATTTPGQFLRGRGIFRERCASCHQLGTTGHAVGPNLATLTDRSPEALLVSILDPNRAVETKYFNYSVEMNDLSTHDGIIAEESANSITLKSANGVQATLLRTEIETINSTSRSPMPDGLEDGLGVEEMANLIAFILDARPKPKAFDGNKPEPVKRASNGEIRLLATNAEIYGETLQYERAHRNLGYWGSEDDVAAWVVEVPAAGTYGVTIEYACDESNGGNGFTMTAGEVTVTGEVDSTGGWDRYEAKDVGVISLKPGTNRIAVRASEKLKEYLFDLRGIVLRPK